MPTQSRPASVDKGVLRFVGPAGMGVLEFGELSPPEANVVALTAGPPVGLSVGKALGSWILPIIHLWTREIYWQAGTLTGTLSLLSHVYVMLLSQLSNITLYVYR